MPGRELGGGCGGESKNASGPALGFAVYNEREEGVEFERTLDMVEDGRGRAVRNRFWMVFIVGRGALMVLVDCRRRGRRWWWSEIKMEKISHS